PATAELATLVTAQVTELGGTASLEPPRVADYRLTATRTADGISFTGHVPDEATLTLLRNLDGADVDSLELARGAPDRFASGLDFGLALLSRLSEGTIELKGTRLSVGG